jgi:curved DNA-binding protein CbpA
VVTENEFVDFYELFRVAPDAEQESIQRVHRALAARYHPDNKETGDLERFLLVNKAFKTLTDPGKRKEYDAEYQSHKGNPIPIFMTREFADGIEGESNRRMGVLCLLYTRRRTNPNTPALSVLELESLTLIPREHLVFTIWYLKSKKYIVQDDRSSLMITADGIDYLEDNLPRHRTVHKLIEAADMGATKVDFRETHQG